MWQTDIGNRNSISLVILNRILISILNLYIIWMPIVQWIRIGSYSSFYFDFHKIVPSAMAATPGEDNPIWRTEIDEIYKILKFPQYFLKISVILFILAKCAHVMALTFFI